MIRFLKYNDGLIPFLSLLLLLLGEGVRLVAFGLPTMKFLTISTTINETTWLSAMFWFLNMVVFLAFLLFLNRIMQQYGLLMRLSNLPWLFAVVFFFVLPRSSNHVFTWIALALALWSYQQTLDFMSGSAAKVKSFWSGFALGISTTLMPFFALQIPVFVQAAVLSGFLTARRLLIYLVGLFFPIYMLFLIQYVVLNDWMIPRILLLRFNWSFSSWGIANWLLVLVSLLVVLLAGTQSLKSASLKDQRRFAIFMLLSILSLLSALILSFDVFVLFMLVPFTYSTSRWVQVIQRNWIGDVYMVLLLACVVALNT